MLKQYLEAGRIVGTHGIRGEVKVFPTTDDVNRFKQLKEVLLDTGKEKIELKVESCKFFKQFVILKFKGINDINDIEIPTIPSMLDEISHNLEKIPLSDITGNMNTLLQNLNSDIPDLMRQSTAAVASVNKLATALSGPGSTTINDLNKMIRDVSDAARAVSRLSDYLERHPEALLKGKGGY